jgi:hypothetical protein
MLLHFYELNNFVKNPPEHSGFRTINKKLRNSIIKVIYVIL